MTSLNWIPREVERAAEPQLVKKHQRRFTSMDDKILFLYAQGMTTREIVTTFKEMYGADVSATPISKVTDAVIEQIDEWQSYPLDAIQPIVYLDCIVVKIRQDKKVLNKAIYLALGVNLEGHKELSGLWLSGNEGAKFWLNLLTELQNRGVKNILIACVDGLKGFPDAINTALYCAYATELDEVGALERLQACAADLKKIYQSITGEEALPALDKFSDRWDNKHPGQPLLECLLAKSQHAVYYPEDRRKVIYTTNAIESLNSVIRKAIKKRKLFPTDDSAKKVIHLAIQAASKKWTMPIRHWKPALNRFMIEFEERLAEYI